MKSSQVPFLPLGIGAVFVSAITFSLYGQFLQGDQNRRERFRVRGTITDEGPAGSFERSGRKVPPGIEITEAPTGFDNLTNGFDQQGPPFEQINEDTVKPLRSFNDNRFIFEEVETIADGLGPTYNAQSCRECHQNVVTGGASQVAEHRTGRLAEGAFFESLGGSLIQSRATHPDIVERVAFEDDIRTFRISTNTLGNGFVECIADATLLAIRDGQPAAMQGTALMVAGSGSGEQTASRSFRMEEPARQPRVILGGCLSERDGYHQPALPRREHLKRGLRRVWHALRSRSRPGG